MRLTPLTSFRGDILVFSSIFPIFASAFREISISSLKYRSIKRLFKYRSNRAFIMATVGKSMRISDLSI